MDTSKKEQMRKAFHMGDEKYQTSLFVNMRLAEMPKAELVSLCQKYELLPVREYLDTRTIQTECGNKNIRGFIRYIDTYLIQSSGGKRTELLNMGERLTGKRSEAFSMRLIRLDIISEILLTKVEPC